MSVELRSRLGLSGAYARLPVRARYRAKESATRQWLSRPRFGAGGGGFAIG